MKKHATSLFIATALVLAATPAAIYAETGDGTVQMNTDGKSITNHAPGQFDDLEGHFAKGAANRLGDMGMITKKQKTSFQPDAPIDRQEFVDLLQKALGKKIDPLKTADPHLNRLDVALLVAKSMPAINTGINGGDKSFAYLDTPGLSSEQNDALRQLYMVGIMLGDGKGHFNPNASLSRGEAAVLLERVVQRSLQGGKEAAYEQKAGELPQTVYTLVNENKMQEGLFSVVDGETRYLLISGGEVPNGGFTVKLDSITETDAGFFLEASLQAPAPGTEVTEAIAYPHAVVTIKDTTKPVYLITLK